MVLNKEPRNHPKYVRGLRCDSSGPTNEGHWNSCLSQWKKWKWKNGKNKIKLDLYLTHPDGAENLYVKNKT